MSRWRRSNPLVFDLSRADDCLNEHVGEDNHALSPVVSCNTEVSPERIKSFWED